jgi:flagellar L-ring protein FlgH
MKWFPCLVLIGAILSGCSNEVRSLLDQPRLSPVQENKQPELLDEVPFAESNNEDAADPWLGGPADFFRDVKPRRRGDFVIVNVSTNDSAVFNNSTARSKKAANKSSTDFDIGLFAFAAQGKGEAELNGNATASGQGSVTRSEKLRLRLTATVQKVLPNGHLIIEGSQQILVNNELRDVRIAGIVNPSDIDDRNSIDYERIAQARASYGGSGVVSTAQKPAWGVQLWDKLMPF